MLAHSLPATILGLSLLLLPASEAQAQDAGASPPDGGVAASVAPQKDDGGVSSSDAGAPPDGGVSPPAPVGGPAPEPARSRESSGAWVAPRVDIVGRAPRALDRLPGTAAVIRREELRQLAPQSTGDALRTVTGVNIVAEDGMGLRLNLGIRGLDPNRSRKILVLEDGVPVALNPYGAPELYYGPPVERVERIEVVKGSGQILWGPQTIGGVVNFITRDTPRTLTVNADLRYGSYNYLLAQAGVGSRHGAISWRIDAFHRRYEGPRGLDLALTDVSGKLRLQLSARSTLGLKLQYYDERSRATYIGLTAPQYAADPRTIVAPHDRFVVQRFAATLTHQHLFSDQLLLSTNAYAYQTDRAWRRQLYERRDSGADYERLCDGTGRCGPRGAPELTPADDGSTIYFLQNTQNRQRRYWVAGVEPRLTYTWRTAKPVRGELIALARFHYERAREQIFIGSAPTVSAGELTEDEQRHGYALAAAVQNRFTFWEKLHVTPGLRFESYWSRRELIRVPETLPSGDVVGRDSGVQGRAFSYAFIPGIGISADLSESITLFAGVHRGYAPPRSKDSVSSTGQNLQLDPELSWNTELGLRARVGRWLSAELAGFHMEFENQIIPPSESAAVVSGGTLNTGHSRHTGFEASALFDLAALLNDHRFSMPLSVSYTYLPLAGFVGGLWDANRLPYAPQHLLYAQLRFAHRVGVSAQVGVAHVSSQFTDKENTQAQSRDGLVGLMPAYTTLDARIAYTFNRAGLTLYVAGKNLTNQIFIINRAPSGIQPAGFLQVFGGVEWNWARTASRQPSAEPGVAL